MQGVWTSCALQGTNKEVNLSKHSTFLLTYLLACFFFLFPFSFLLREREREPEAGKVSSFFWTKIFFFNIFLGWSNLRLDDGHDR